MRWTETKPNKKGYYWIYREGEDTYYLGPINKEGRVYNQSEECYVKCVFIDNNTMEESNKCLAKQLIEQTGGPREALKLIKELYLDSLIDASL